MDHQRNEAAAAGDQQLHAQELQELRLDTRIVHNGRASAAMTQSVNPPLVRASTITFTSYADFRKSYDGPVFESPRYGRSGTATNFELQSAMASLSNAETCIATACGLSAIAAVLGAHAHPGAHILVQEGVYGPARNLCDTMLAPAGCHVEYFSSSRQAQEKMNERTTLVYVEIPASLSMRMLDVEALCAIARKRNIPVASDSTWGTPIFFDAHALGISISIHAATKFINGHSDVMLGLVTGSYDALASTRSWCDRSGSHVSADACWLALRGLRTLGVRMERHQRNSLQVAQWLQQQPQIKNVLFPALPGDEGHALWKKQFSGAGGPFTFELRACDQTAFEQFIDALRLFGLGTSWGGFESLVMPAIPHHLRSLERQPDEGRMVRVHIGLEDPGDLCDDLAQALRFI